MQLSPEALTQLSRFARSAEASPSDADAQMFHGNALFEAGQPKAAIDAYRAALRLRPGHAPAYYNLGNALLTSGAADAALAAFDAALALAPDHASCLNNRGNALRHLGRVAEAVDSYRAAVTLRPDLPGTHNNLGSALLALHQPDAAIESLRAAIRIWPEYAEACDNMGGALLALDRPEEALTWFRRAVAIEPDAAQAQFGIAMALLTVGRLREGFAAYEARWLDPRFAEDVRDYAAPLWLGGSEVSGRTLLIYAEQGLGDTLHFVRYASLLRECGARVVLEVQRPLVTLLRGMADGVVSAGDPLPAHDLRTPLLSLPHAFGTDLRNIPSRVPYLTAPASRDDPRGPGFNVAVTVSGSPDHPEDALRSIPIAVLAPIFELAGATFHVVQKDLRAEDAAWLRARPAIRVYGEDLPDFAATAALLAAMDLVISVDTAVAHLAGALAVPVWILLQHAADFRWLRGRDDSPWYPTARLFRQTSERHWHDVVSRVEQSLRDAASARTPRCGAAAAMAACKERSP